MKKEDIQLDAAQFVAIARKLSPAVRTELTNRGYVFPATATAHDDDIVWGYRCVRCGEVALVFVGTKFWDPGRSIWLDTVPSHLSIDQLPWIHNVGRHPANHLAPNCQHCNSTVDLQGRYLISRLIVPVKSWTEAREKAINEVRETLRQPPIHSDTTPNPEAKEPDKGLLAKLTQGV